MHCGKASGIAAAPESDRACCEFQGLLTEFPGKEIQLHLVGAHGQLVIENSSPVGAAHVHTELNQLTESLKSLRKMTIR